MPVSEIQGRVMAKVSIGRWAQRPGRLVLSYRDHNGKKITAEFPDTEEGELAASEEKNRIRRMLMAGEVPPDDKITVREYFDLWISTIKGRVAPGTLRIYRSAIQSHVIPQVGGKKLIHVNRSIVKSLVSKMLGAVEDDEEKYSRYYIAKVLATMRAMFSEAVEDGTLAQNPAVRLVRRLGLEQDRDSVKAMTLDEAGIFLAACKEVNPQIFLAFTTYLNTGMRLGEGLGLQIDDLDVCKQTLTIRRNLTADGVMTRRGKTVNAFRMVEIPRSLVDLILSTLDGRKARGIMSPWLLSSKLGLPPTLAQINAARQVISKTMKRVLIAANLPTHFSPHCLRHSFAQIHMDAGTDLLWISRQLGHASIKMTADTYGKSRTPKHPEAAENLGKMLTSAAEGADRKRVTKFAVRRVSGERLAIGL